MKINPNLTFGNIFEPNWKAIERIVVNRGGSSSGKTGTLIRMFLIWLFYGKIDNSGKVFEKGVASIVRKYSNNLTKSILRDWENVLDETGTRQFVEINKTERTYKFGGRTLEFIGVDDPQKARGPRRDILYCNEANELTYEDCRRLNMRTRYRTFVDFNPDDEDIWINTELEQKRSVEVGDVKLIVSTYLDNPFLSEEIVQEIEHLASTDENYWRIYGLGEYGRLDGKIFEFTEIKNIPPEAKLIGYGLDFGYTNDPTALVGVYQFGDYLIMDELIYETRLTNVKIANIIKSLGITNEEIWADSSEPKSIEELYTEGLNIHGVVKGAGSIINGIDIMKRYKLMVTERSLNLRKEMRKYIWKKDKNGKSLNVPIDEDNHAIDATRYLVMSKLSKKKKKQIRIITT